MPESCRIQYDQYYDQLGAQFVLVIVYEDGSAIDEVWSNSGSLDDEDEVKQYGEQQLMKLLDRMRGDGWDLVSTEETQSLDTTPVSRTHIYHMQRDK
ncbi:MAG: hypothetical protein U0694_06225 [Anaerolineae bacterium]